MLGYARIGLGYVKLSYISIQAVGPTVISARWAFLLFNI
jgi:hypothetical protein